MSFVDFDRLKEELSFEQAITMLGLTLTKKGNQWRGACPACKKGDERSLVVTEGKGYFCWADKKGGDLIAFAAHIKQCSAKDAAQFLSDSSKSTVPQVKGQAQEGGFQALTYLEHAHEAIAAVGFDPEFCKRVGIGYAGKGILRGTIAIPIRDEKGTLLGYVGATDLTIPPSFTTNVVQLKRPA